MIFCELGPSRTVLQVYRQVTGKSEARQLPGSWTSASSKYRWRDRARAWDGRGAKVAQEAREEVIRNDAAARTREEIRSARRLEQEEAEWAMQQKLLAKAEEMLASALYRRKTEDGANVIQPARWSLRTAVDFIELAHRLGRASAKMPILPEEDKSADPSMEFFDTSGQLAEVLPAGVAPDMPAEVHVKPPIGDVKGGGGTGLTPMQPAIVKPVRPV